MGGERNKRDVFFIYYIQDPLRSAELSQCDCKYHFYGIKLGIESPDRFVSSLILHVSHHVCVCVRLRVCLRLDVRMYPVHGVCGSVRVVLVNFNKPCAGGFQKSISHSRSCIKSVLTGVCVFFFFSNKVQSETEYTIRVLQIIKWKKPGER